VALELPGWLVNVFYVIGLPWPGVDEDELRAWAQSVRAFADDVTSSSAGTHQAVTELAASSQSSSVATLAAHWEHRSQLVADLHGPINDFADALEVAADAVVVQKYAVLVAATVLADEFIATQVTAFFTFGLDEAALPAEIISTREIVKAALEFLEAELLGKLIGIAVEDVTGHLSRFLAEFLGVALPAAGEVAGMKLAYDTVRDAAWQARVQGAGTEDTGHVAYLENANRNIEDASEGGAAAGDGGRWAAVVQAVEEGLRYIAQVLFKGLSEAISEIQHATADGLDRFANAIEDADEGLGRDIHPPAVRGGGVAARVDKNLPGEDNPPELELDDARDRWKTISPEFRGYLKQYEQDHPAPRAAATAELNAADRATVVRGWKRVSEIEENTITPAMKRIAAADPARELIGLDKRLKGLDRTLAKVAQAMNEQGLTAEQALANMNDVARYTFNAPEEHYAASYAADVQRLKDAGFQHLRTKPRWDADQVRDVNTVWEIPGTGERFEVQFHTGISFEATRLTHPAFERTRIPIPQGISANEKNARLTDNKAMENFQSRVNKYLPVPPGAGDIQDYRKPQQ
jgi:hypothetical protein